MAKNILAKRHLLFLAVYLSETFTVYTTNLLFNNFLPYYF